ncbi:MAG: aldehyde dehydrogenase family protein, partial [Aggregatilineales bacterium]
DLPHAIENVIDGVFFNSGQSCCGIERIYVHQDVYDDFLAGAVDLTKKYILGNPLDAETTLGPMVRTSAADFVRGQIKEAVAQGAQSLIDPALFAANEDNTPYMAPQILIDVNHQMDIMIEESFGPVVGIMAVNSDEEAIRLMNDSKYGLTASVWTKDLDAALTIGNQVNTGTWYMNRCDYLDPTLAWTGVKDSGRGCTLSSIGYESLTRPKSFHLRIV